MNHLLVQSSRELSLEVYTTMQLCQTINTPRALSVYLMLKYEEYSQYLDLKIDPCHYEDASVFRGDLLVTKVMSKSPNLPHISAGDRRKEAVTTFKRSEARCKEINDMFWATPDTQLPVWFFSLQNFVAKLLDPLTQESLDRILDLTSHGPGSTTGVRGVGSTVVEKFQQHMHLTTNLYPFCRSIMGSNWSDLNDHPREIVKGSRFTTVPKTAKTDRGICVEPTLNVYLQKGIGAYIRERLRRFGLDLDVQAEKNRIAAKRAYRDDLCTIDLEAASDSISWVMLQRVMPTDWCHLLALSRSPSTKIEGNWVDLQKVSSMGNGYTFELESLLFLGLCRSLVPLDEWDDVHVFGDDIIIPRKYVASLIEALNFLGFSVNRAKSFLEGNFFESCGTDWFKGVQVRPFYLKGSVENIPYPVQIANKLRLFASQVYNGLFCDSSYLPLWKKLLKRCPPQWRKCRVPKELGDVGIIASERELLVKRQLNDDMKWEEGVYIRTIMTLPKKRVYRSYGIVLNALANVAVDEPTYGRLPVRGLFGLQRSRWTRIATWSSGLEWDLLK